MEPEYYHRAGDRRGVALILVIGMLALMMVLGVTFSIFMRSERTAAGNFRADVQNRELMQVALARAVDNIGTTVAGNMYPSWDVLTSPGADQYVNAISGYITNFVPSEALGSTAAKDVTPGWISINTPGLGARKVAYVVLNCSGLLDANYAGGGTRGCGTTPDEVELTEVPVANMTQYKDARPYVTQQDLAIRGYLTSPPQSLVTYSAFPNLYDGGTNRGLVDISGDETKLKTNKVAIIAAFKASIAGASDPDGEFFFNNLLDYVDIDNEPKDLGSPCTELVPMVNEVRARAYLGDVNVAAKTCLSAVEVEAEWYYPFVKASGDKFKMVVDVLITTNNSALVKYVPASPSLTYPNLAVAPSLVKAEATESPYTKNVTGCSSNDVVSLKAQIGIRIMNGAGKVVDSVPYPYETNQFFTLIFPDMKFPAVAPADIVGGTWVGCECVDPRFNWNTGEDYWSPYPDPDGIIGEGSMGQINKIATYLRNNSPTEYDLFSDMYVADAPLHNVGELSFLLRSRDPDKTPYWNTLRLWADNRIWPIDRVLDHFVVSSNQIRRGLINVNSRSVAAWTDVFYNMPKDSYPGEAVAASAKVSETEAKDMAVVMINFTGASLARLSDVGLVTNLFAAAGLSGAMAIKKRSMLRNISSLIDVRQQYYLVLLYGVPKTIQGKGEVASVQAVAEVWRDPLPRSDGVHPLFVRSFQFIKTW